MNEKRKDYIDWNTYYMGVAAMASFRSKDPNTQNGIVFVDENMRQLSTGYNGFPEGCSDDEFPWSSPEKYPYAEHAERNAIYNATRTATPLMGSTAYLYSERGYYPCSDCARGIIQVGCKKIIMAWAITEDTKKYSWDETKRMFEATGIEIEVMNYSAKEAFHTIIEQFKDAKDNIKL